MSLPLTPGAGCLKLTVLLVNVSLKFYSTKIHLYFFQRKIIVYFVILSYLLNELN